MRPTLLDPYFAPLARLPGIGPKMAALFDRLLDRVDGGARLIDLVFHLPSGAIDRRLSPNLAAAPIGTTATVRIYIDAHSPPPPSRARAPYKVLTSDDTGDLTLVFFKTFAGQMAKTFPPGEERIVSGTIELFDGMRQMTHPERVLTLNEVDKLDAFEPVYPLTEGLSSRRVHTTVSAAFERLGELWPGERE